VRGPPRGVARDAAPASGPVWTDAAALSGTHALRAEVGAWRSPRLRVEPGAYYRVRFASKADGAALWALESYDSDGRPLDAVEHAIEASASWAVEGGFARTDARADFARLRFQPLNRKRLDVDDVRVDPARREEALAAVEAAIGSIPLPGGAPAGPRGFLPRTMDTLRAGRPLRIVLLGDEVVHDMAVSPFDLLLERRYPGARVVPIPSTRPGTGCWYYQHGIRVKNFILELAPDLLLIGGNSNQDDTEAIRRVVQQVRAASACEILVMSGAMAPGPQGDLRTRPEWKPDPAPYGAAYRDRLMRMAREEKVEFYDLEGAWGRYLRGCGKPYDWFFRDAAHANARGRLVLAKLLERYFALEPAR
jgi:hypothetical protein